MTLVTICPICRREELVTVNEKDYEKWEKGMLVQDAFPYLTADEREMLISGICSDCWEKTFGDSDEDEEDNEGWVEFEPGKFIWDEMAANP